VRYLNLRESLTFVEDLNNSAAVPAPLTNARQIVEDRFATRNEFYGGQVGVQGRWQRERFTVDGRAKVALGVTQQALQIDGSQVVIQPNGTRITSAGGLYALSSNIGSFQRNNFGVVPEAG